MKRALTGLAIMLALVLGSTGARADLIVNGGFETGDFSGWTLTGNTGFTGVTGSPYAHSGNYGAYLGPVGSLGYLSQDIATDPGCDYDLSFWLRNDGGTPNAFQALIDNGVAYAFVNRDAFDWVNISLLFTATGSTTNIAFGYQQNPAYFGLDDISVVMSDTCVPEPASLTLLGLGGLALAVRRLRKRG